MRRINYNSLYTSDSWKHTGLTDVWHWRVIGRFGNDTEGFRPGSLRWFTEPHQTVRPCRYTRAHLTMRTSSLRERAECKQSFQLPEHTTQGDSRVLAQPPFLVPPTLWGKRRTKRRTMPPFQQLWLWVLSSSCYQAWAVTYSTGSFPRVSTTGNFLGGSSWYRAPHPRTDTCKLAEAEWAEEVGVNRRRRQGYEGWAAEREMEGNNEAFCFLWPWIRQKVAYSPAHVSFHLWASGFSPGQDN